MMASNMKAAMLSAEARRHKSMKHCRHRFGFERIIDSVQCRELAFERSPAQVASPVGGPGMKCPRCQAENVDGARYCEDCGARVEITCAACAQGP